MDNTLEDLFREGIKDDYLIFDNRITLEILHYHADAQPDFDTGTTNRTITSTIVDGCLFRQASVRNGPSVPQLHTREVAIQKDSFISVDVVIEVPWLDGLIIKDEDTIRNPTTLQEWKVLVVDYSTFDTRYRLGVTRLR